MSDAPLVPVARIAQALLVLRGQRVLLDADLAELYQVTTKNLNRAVARNRERFPEDFMFQLTAEEAGNLRFQFGTSRSEHGGRRYLPYAFTEQGVAMLSSVLKSRRAALVNVGIMRAFVRLRALVASNPALARKLAELERKTDARFRVIFKILATRLPPKPAPPVDEPPRRRIGFVAPRPKDPTARAHQAVAPKVKPRG